MQSNSPQTWRQEFWTMLALSIPLVLTNLAQVGMTLTDVAFIGRLGSMELAAAALGSNLYAAITFFGYGLVCATAPLVSQKLGANPDNLLGIRLTVQTGFWSSLLYSIPALLFLWFGENILLLMQQPPELAHLAGVYLRALMWALPPFLGFIVLRSFFAAKNDTKWAFWGALLAILFNALGNWVLVFGNWGFPSLGLTGSGLASSLATWFLFFALSIISYRRKKLAKYRIFHQVKYLSTQHLKRFWKLGLPIAFAVTFEVTIFNAAAFLIGLLSPTELAAHMIAIQIASTAFMIPHGIAQAATIRVGYAHGRKDKQGITKAGWSAFSLGMLVMVVSCSLFILAPIPLIGLFIDLSSENQAVIDFAIHYLIVAAIFQFVDAAQVLCAGMLRGIQDTRVPMLFTALGYWGIGLPSGVVLAFYAHWRGVGIWSGLAIGLTVVSLLMLQRWIRRERRLQY